MKRTSIIALALGCLVLFCASVAAAADLSAFKGQTCVLQTWGGPWGESLEKIIDQANGKFGTDIKVLFNENSQTGIAKIRAMRNAPRIDIQMSIESEAIAADNEGLVAALDTTSVPTLADLSEGALFAGDKFVALYSYPMGLIVRPDKIKNVPAAFADLWKPEYKDQVALPSIEWAGGHHVIVLAAMMRGGGEADIDPGFAALNELVTMGNVKTFYATDDDAIRLVQAGEAGIVVSLLPNAIDFLKSGEAVFVYPSDLPVRLAYDVIWAVKGGQEDYAKAVIDYLLQPEAQLMHSEAIAVLPVNTKLEVPDSIKSMMPPADADTFVVDEDICTPKFDEWKQRYDKEVIGAM